ncbi:hypothetical protein DIPPA_34036 [Diplonema papillatum]|nr:hypothetical protein DIPPA_34036 [Diplonema papillatum]
MGQADLPGHAANKAGANQAQRRPTPGAEAAAEAPGKRTSRGTPPTRRAQTKRDGGQPPAQKRPRKPRFAGLMGAHRIRWLRVPAQPDAPWIDSLRPLFGNARRAGPPPQGPRSGAPNERDPKRKPKLTESLLLKRAARRNSLQQWLSAIDPE